MSLTFNMMDELWLSFILGRNLYRISNPFIKDFHLTILWIEIQYLYIYILYTVFQKKIEKLFDSGAEVETGSRILGLPKSKRSVEF